MILVTGTGRCGTGFVAQLLISAGVRCSHEGVFNTDDWETVKTKLETRLANPSWNWQAESSWLAAPLLPNLTRYPLTIVHIVRHPKHVMDSHLRLMLYTHPHYGPYYHWMTNYLPELNNYHDPVAKAACWYLRVNQMIEPYTKGMFHKVEDPPEHLLDLVGIPYDDLELFSNTNYNSRLGYGPSNVAITDVPEPLRSELLSMSDHYGYQWTEHKPDIVIAGWFGGRTIPISHTSAHVGGSWQLRDDAGNPLCYDAPLVQFFYNKVCQVNNPSVIDIGASTGNFTLLPTVHPMTVYAFEPNPVAFRSLHSNVIINNLTNKVHLYQTALSDYTDATTLKVPVPALHAAIACLGNGNPRPRGFEWNEIDVDVARLDDYHFAPDFIKIDVEGAELSVLQGAEKTIKQHHPSILTEYTSLNTRQFGYEREEIIELLRGWGYNHFRPVGLEDLWAEVLLPS